MVCDGSSAADRTASNPELAALADMPVLNFEAIASYVFTHDDPWQGLHEVFEVMRAKNNLAGGDDRGLGEFVAFAVAISAPSLPIAAGWRK